MVNISSSDCPSKCCLRVESLKHIDLSTFSQSELRSLSLASSAAFDLHSKDHSLPIPQIHRSLFNESAGSRRQTYSRSRHNPKSYSLLPTPSDDPHRSENASILASLKRLMGVPDAPLPQKFEIMEGVGSKRKRVDQKKQKQQLLLHGEFQELEILNRNGVAVDLLALAAADAGDDPYAEELRRRTAGMESEQELLGFLKDSVGHWGSRRKRRKIVDACQFGDALPVGWKLLLGIRRKGGRPSIYCRRYISPNGQQFASCKEASAYLQSCFGLDDTDLLLDDSGNNDNVQQGSILASGSHAGVTLSHQDDSGHDMNSHMSLDHEFKPDICEKDVGLLGFDNLSEVQVRDIFECRKCNMTFDEKDAYLQHLLSSHQNTTRRYRLRTSVGDGVILKDGKFECQFCHKVFSERRRYNGHVGIHVRNYVRSCEELPSQATFQKTDSPLSNAMPPKMSKMDALIEIAQHSILEASNVGLADETDKLNVVAHPGSALPSSSNAGSIGCEISKSASDNILTGTVPLDPELEREGSDEKESEQVMVNEVEKFDDAHIAYQDSIMSASNNFGGASGTFNVDDDSAKNVDITKQPVIKKLKNCETHALAPLGDQENDVVEEKMHLGSARIMPAKDMENYHNSVGSSYKEPNSDLFMQTIQKNSEEIGACGITESSLSLSNRFPSPSYTQYKGNEFGGVDQKLDSGAGFDDLRLDELEPLKYSFLTNDSGIGADFGATVQFEPGEAILNMAGTQQITAVCVWCRMEFNHQAVDPDIQSESVGFMCPTCKDKISGQLNVLDTAFPMSPHPF